MVGYYGTFSYQLRNTFALCNAGFEPRNRLYAQQMAFPICLITFKPSVGLRFRFIPLGDKIRTTDYDLPIMVFNQDILLPMMSRLKTGVTLSVLVRYESLTFPVSYSCFHVNARNLTLHIPLPLDSSPRWQKDVLRIAYLNKYNNVVFIDKLLTLPLCRLLGLSSVG